MEIGIVTSTLPADGAVLQAVAERSNCHLSPSIAAFEGSGLDAIMIGGIGGLKGEVLVDLDAPIVPVDTDLGVADVPPELIDAALEALEAGQATPVARSLLSVRLPDQRALRAGFETTLMTTVPGTISEFEIREGERVVGTFRADGVCISTPAASGGYGATEGGPILSPATEAVAVLPISPFLTRKHRWVLDPDRLELVTVRDESAVGLFADDRVVTRVGPGEPIHFEADRSIRTLRLPQSRSPYQRRVTRSD